MSKKKAIGIDLGTSKCCVGVFRNDKVEILENERGNKTTPSYVAFTDTERLVGEDAKDQAALNPANTVFGVKRIIGREFKDSLVEAAIDKMPYTIMNKPEGETCIHVSYKDVEELLLPQQVTAMLLGKMKDLAEGHLKSSVDEAVISVPASFSNAQRQATKDAAAIAGLKVLALINEPTAAAIAYEANRRKTDEENIAIVDFGAGNLDVAIVTIRRGRVCARAVSGSTAIGGNDIDEVLMKHVGGKFEDRYGKMDQLSGGGAMIERLRSSCEKLKRNLTLLPKVQETLDCFGDENVLSVTIKRDDFNSMIPSEVQSSLHNCLHRASQESGISLKEIARVVLVGGSSRIPLFQNLLETIFGKKSLDKSVNPDEAVACGAALYAALLSGDNELEELNLKDCLTNNFCFSLQGDSIMQHVFEQHSSKTLPQERKFPFNGLSPFNEKTRAHTFELYEELAGQKNPHRLIGTLCLDDEFRQAVYLISDVIFKIDRCGIFNVVVHLKPDHEFPEVVKNCAGKLGKGKLQTVIEREQQFRRDDLDEKERVEAMTNLEALCFRLKSEMGDNKANDIFPELVKQISYKATENIHWLDASDFAPKTESVERQNKLVKLKNIFESKIKQYEKEEKERLAAVMNLESYCSFLETSVITGMADDTELVAALAEQSKEATEWLKSSDRPSKVDCDNRTDDLKKVHAEIKKRFEIKQREDERRAAVDDLRQYCCNFQATKLEGKEFDSVRYDVRRLTEESVKCMEYINKIELPSKAECDSRKQRLEKMVCEVEKQVEQRRANQQESERLAAVSRLRSLCIDLEFLARSFPESDAEGHPIAALGSNTSKETRQWLSGPKNGTQEECNAQQKIIENYINTLNDLVNKDRQACIKWFKTRYAYVEQTLLIELSWKKERYLCNNVIEKKDELLRYLETAKFLRKDYDKKVATFETAVGTLKNKMKKGYPQVFPW